MQVEHTVTTAPLPLLYFLLSFQSLTFKGKMSTSLKFKEKATDLDTRSYKCLLLALVKLIHADPKLMLHVSLVVALFLCGIRINCSAYFSHNWTVLYSV